MNEDPTPAPRNWGRLVGVLTVVALIAGVGVGVWQWELSRRPKVAQAQPPQDPVGDEVIIHALDQAGVQDAEKSRWVDEVPGVALGELGLDERRIFLRFANARRCTCGCGFTLGACRNYDSECEVSLPRVQALYDSVQRGLIVSAQGLREPPPTR